MTNDNEDEFEAQETPSGLKPELMTDQEPPAPEPDFTVEEDDEELAEMEFTPIIDDFESANGYVFGLVVNADEEGELSADLTLDNVSVVLPLEDFCQFAVALDAALPRLLEMVGRQMQRDT